MVVEETASGEDEVRWESRAWYEYVSYVVYLIWLFGCSAAIPTATLAIDTRPVASDVSLRTRLATFRARWKSALVKGPLAGA